jgi:hypothetical protein
MDHSFTTTTSCARGGPERDWPLRDWSNGTKKSRTCSQCGSYHTKFSTEGQPVQTENTTTRYHRVTCEVLVEGDLAALSVEHRYANVRPMLTLWLNPVRSY